MYKFCYLHKSRMNFEMLLLFLPLRKLLPLIMAEVMDFRQLWFLIDVSFVELYYWEEFSCPSNFSLCWPNISYTLNLTYLLNVTNLFQSTFTFLKQTILKIVEFGVSVTEAICKCKQSVWKL